MGRYTAQDWVLLITALGGLVTIIGGAVVTVIKAWSSLRQEVIAAKVAGEGARAAVEDVKKETTAQTVIIKEAAKAAGEAADHANGSLKRVEDKLEASQQARVDDAKEGRAQAVDALANSQPVTAAVPATTPIVLQVTAAAPTPRPARAGDEPKPGGSS